MYIGMIIVATLMFSFQFVFNNGFQKEEGSSLNSSLKYTLYSSIAGFFVLLFTNKIHIEISLFSTIISLIYTIVCIALSYASVKAFQYANLSVYSVFSMIGGMLLPFLYGLALGEEFKIIRIICCVFIAISVAMSINKGEHNSKAIKYYLGVFFLNGMVGVISKFHQSFPQYCVDSGSFMILTRVFSVFITLGLLLAQKKRNFSVSKKALLYSVFNSVLNGIGNLLLLIALLHLPASVQYPIVTGGVIVISTLITAISGAPLRKKEILAAVIAFIATIFMAI